MKTTRSSAESSPASSQADDLADKVVRLVNAKLPEQVAWVNPSGYHQSLALCIIDSIQSLGVRYGSVVAVVQRYREARPGLADTDGAIELLASFDLRGGVEHWVRDIGNHNRTSSKPDAPLKASVIRAAADLLIAEGVPTAVQLRELDENRSAALKAKWRALPGQRSGISWRYFLMLAGVPGVKADRMICRFVQSASGRSKPVVTPSVAGAAVEAAAERVGVPTITLDHAIWRWQSGPCRR